MSVFYLILAGIFETMWPFGFKLAHGSAYRDWWIAGSLLAVALSIIFFYLSQKKFADVGGVSYLDCAWRNRHFCGRGYVFS